MEWLGLIAIVVVLGLFTAVLMSICLWPRDKTVGDVLDRKRRRELKARFERYKRRAK